MNDNRRTPQKKRKMPVKQRVAIAIVRAVEGQEEKKKQKQAAKKKQSAPKRQSAQTRQPAPKKQPAQRPAQRPAAQIRRPAQTKPAAPKRPLTQAEKQRRAAYLRRMRRRRRNIRIVAAVLVVLAVFMILSGTVLFKIQQIEVTNPEKISYTVDQVVAQSGVTYGAWNLFRCDVDKVEKNIEQRLPYIGHALVERDFPSTLRVTVTPTVATAAIAYGSTYLLIDKDGKMLEAVATAPETIPVLRCNAEFTEDLGKYIGVTENKKDADEKTEAAAEMIALYKKVYEAAKQAGIDELTLIDIRDSHAITLMYQNRLTLHLGTEDMLETKLKTAAKTIAAESDASKTRTGAMDLTSVPYAYVRDTFDTTGVEATTDAEAATEPVTENA